MDKKSVQDALLALTHEMESRSKTAQLQQVLSQIEDAQKAGVRNAKIVETLNKHGFSLTLKTFEMMLYRIRERQRLERQKSTETQINAVTSLEPKKGANPPPRLNPPTPLPVLPDAPVDASGAQEKANLATDDLAGLNQKQRRERLGDLFIPDAPENPLLKRIKKDQ